MHTYVTYDIIEFYLEYCHEFKSEKMGKKVLFIMANDRNVKMQILFGLLTIFNSLYIKSLKLFKVHPSHATRTFFIPVRRNSIMNLRQE